MLREHDIPIAPSTYDAYRDRGFGPTDADRADAYAAHQLFQLRRKNRRLYDLGDPAAQQLFPNADLTATSVIDPPVSITSRAASAQYIGGVVLALPGGVQTPPQSSVPLSTSLSDRTWLARTLGYGIAAPARPSSRPINHRSEQKATTLEPRQRPWQPPCRSRSR